MRHGRDHSENLGTVLPHDVLADLAQPERVQRLPLVLLATDTRPDLGDLELLGRRRRVRL